MFPVFFNLCVIVSKVSRTDTMPRNCTRVMIIYKCSQLRNGFPRVHSPFPFSHSVLSGIIGVQSIPISTHHYLPQFVTRVALGEVEVWQPGQKRTVN